MSILCILFHLKATRNEIGRHRSEDLHAEAIAVVTQTHDDCEGRISLIEQLNRLYTTDSVFKNVCNCFDYTHDEGSNK